MEDGVVVLIIGGFNMIIEIVKLVDEFEMLILCIFYDIFIVVIMINWVLSD